MLPFDAAQRATRFDCSVSGLVKSKQVTAGPASLISLQGYNKAIAGRYIQVFDVTFQPADGSIPVAVVKAPASSNFFLEVPVTGLPFHNGIRVCVSTTEETLTLSADNDVLVWGSIVGDVA